MKKSPERILLVESDPEKTDLIGRQVLQPLGYKVQVAGAAGQAIQEALRTNPDVILADLNLPGLSGKDLLVALSSQGVETPVIVIAEKGMEGDVIQAFRLGAADYLTAPLREAEIVAAVERVLKQVRARREREDLARQLQGANAELQKRVRELTTIFALGKAVTSITNRRLLFDQIVGGAVYLAEADLGWLLVREEDGKQFVLGACKNLPTSISGKIDQPWEDGLSSLVAVSGEALTISGEPLKRFKIALLAHSVLVTPVKAKKEVIGLLVVGRKDPKPFTSACQALLEAVADYASISLVNFGLFRALEKRAAALQQTAEAARTGETLKGELLYSLAAEVDVSTRKTARGLSHAQEIPGLPVPASQALQACQTILQRLDTAASAVLDAQKAGKDAQSTLVDLRDIARSAAARFNRIAARSGVSLAVEMSSDPLPVAASAYQLACAVDALLANAVRYSPLEGAITLSVTAADGQAALCVKDCGSPINADQLDKVFSGASGRAPIIQGRFTGITASLKTVKQIAALYGGRVWAENDSDGGASFSFSLPLART